MLLRLTDDEARLLLEALEAHRETVKEDTAFAWHMGVMESHTQGHADLRAIEALVEKVQRERLKV